MKAVQVISGERLGGGAPGAYRPAGLIEYRGVRAMAAGTANLSRSLMEFGQQIQTAVRLDMVSHNYALAQKDIADAELSMRADPDHRSIPGKFSQALDDVRAKYSDRIFDPVARNMFQQKFLQYGTAREIQMKYYTWGREQDAQYAHVIEELDIKAGLIEALPLEDKTTYNVYLQEGLDVINQRQATGNLKESSAVKLRIAWREDTAKRRAFQNVMSDPWGTYRALTNDTWKKDFPYLDGTDRLNLIKQAETRINQFDAIARRDRKDALAASKLAEEQKHEVIGKDFTKRITLDPFSLTETEILNSTLPAKKGPNNQQHYLKMRQDAIDERLYGKRNPWKQSDPQFLDEMLTKAGRGELDPMDIQAIPGKLSVDAAQTVKEEARQARGATGDTQAKQYQELKRIAIDDGRSQIEIATDITGGRDRDSIARANIFEQNLLKAIYSETDVEKRINMLTRGTDEYIVDKLVIPHLVSMKEYLSTISRKYNPEKEQAVTEREEARRILRIRRAPVTEANIDYVIKTILRKPE